MFYAVCLWCLLRCQGSCMHRLVKNQVGCKKPNFWHTLFWYSLILNVPGVVNCVNRVLPIVSILCVIDTERAWSSELCEPCVTYCLHLVCHWYWTCLEWWTVWTVCYLSSPSCVSLILNVPGVVNCVNRVLPIVSILCVIDTERAWSSELCEPCVTYRLHLVCHWYWTCLE